MSDNILRRAVRAIAAENEELEDDDLRQASTSLGATHVATCHDRERVTVRGTVRSLTLRPRSGTPALEVELYDGTGSVTLIWLGRREIIGIRPGRQLRATGCISAAGGHRVMYNPRYELIVADTA